ncbi:hypothetical protein Tco_0829065, partial [Tanacetum coccineum]
MDIVRPKASNSPIKRSYFTKPVYRPKDLKPDVKTFRIKNMTTVGTRAVVSKGKVENVLKKANGLEAKDELPGSCGNQEICYRYLQWSIVVALAIMTGNKAYFLDYEEFNWSLWLLESDPKGDELMINLFSVSPMCRQEKTVSFFTELNAYLVSCFKLLDESQVVLRALEKCVYAWILRTLFPSGDKPLKKTKRRTASQRRQLKARVTKPTLTDRAICSTDSHLFSYNRIYKDHPKGQILGDPTSTVQTEGRFKSSSAQKPRPSCKEINDVGEVSTIWKSRSVRVLKSQDSLSKGANSLQAEDIPPPIITAMKISIIKKGEYDIWSMRMRQYICYTYHNLWDVIVNGDLEEEPAPTTGETSAPPTPKTAKQL